MMQRWKLIILLMIGIFLVFSVLARIDKPGDESFVGLCVYSSDGFSVMTNGKTSLGVYAELKLGGIYNVTGGVFNTSSGLRMRPKYIRPSLPTFPTSDIKGFYWPSRGYYLLIPDSEKRTKLALPLNISKGDMVNVKGLFYRGRLYPVAYSKLTPPSNPRDGMPWRVEGVVLYSSRKPILWNGSDKIVLYLPYSLRLKPGTEVKVLGIFRRYSMPSLIVDSQDDVTVIGMAPRVPFMEAGIGKIAVGACMVVGRGKSSLRLDCTKLRLTGFNARMGDTIRFEALVRKSSLLCLNCSVQEGREELPNGICNFSPGEFVKVHGRVEWVRIYGNGFGLANVTKDNCWVLLKLRKSLGISLTTNEAVTAYGTFKTYHGMPALNIESGDDVCFGNC